MSSEQTLSCHCCGAQTTKACRRCVERVYCSEECQSEDWEVHRMECVETTDVEGALDRLRGRTNFESIFPDFFLAVWGYATHGRTADATLRQRLQQRHVKTIEDILNKKLKVTRRKIRGPQRLSAYANAQSDLQEFWNFVKKRADDEETSNIPGQNLFTNIGVPTDVDVTQLIADVANAAKGSKIESEIRKTSKAWGRALDKELDKR